MGAVIPLLVPADLLTDLKGTSEGAVAEDVAQEAIVDVTEAGDNLLAAQVSQSHSANTSRGKEVVYKEGDLVMLSTFNRWCDYKQKGEKLVAEFMPR